MEIFHTLPPLGYKELAGVASPGGKGPGPYPDPQGPFSFLSFGALWSLASGPRMPVYVTAFTPHSGLSTGLF